MWLEDVLSKFKRILLLVSHSQACARKQRPWMATLHHAWHLLDYVLHLLKHVPQPCAMLAGLRAVEGCILTCCCCAGLHEQCVHKYHPAAPEEAHLLWWCVRFVQCAHVSVMLCSSLCRACVLRQTCSACHRLRAQGQLVFSLHVATCYPVCVA